MTNTNNQNLYQKEITDKKIKAKLCNGNIKVGNMGVWSVLMSDEDIYIDSWNQSITGTCGKHCTCCKPDCYVKKSYRRYPSVKLGHARNTLIMRTDVDKMYNDLYNQIKHKRIPYKTIRINQSGELENPEQFTVWTKLASDYPSINFYVYTKAYEIVEPLLLSGEVPENLTVLYSIWHDSGIKEFNKVKHLPNVKAFAYDDNYDYEKEQGIKIQTYCKAYNKKGKMDHSVTCDICKKCFNKNANHKIIGCYDH